MMRLGCLFSVLFVVVVLVLADLAVTELVERAAAARVSDRIDGTATVDISGWPGTVRLATGTADAEVTARNVALQDRDVILSRVALTLNDISASTSGVRVKSGDLVATIREEELARLLRLPSDLPFAGIKLEPDRVRLEFDGIPAASARLSVVDNVVVLQPDGPLLSGLDITVPLEGLPLGVRITDVDVRKGRIDVVGVLTGPALRRLEFSPFSR